MRVERVEVFTVKIPHHYRVGGHAETPGRLPGTDYYVEPQWVHAYSSKLESCVVKVTADDGTVGWGEAQAPLTPETPCALITTLFAPALLGENPLATAAIEHRLYHLMLARGHTGGFLLDAIAGLDIALWDLRGRHFTAPVCELLGGPFRDRLTAYISGLRVSGLEAKVRLAKELVATGYAGVKVFSGSSLIAVADEIRAVREAIGPEAFLAMDAICKYNLSEATQAGRVLDETGASWFEAPLDMEDVDGHAELARKLSTPIAIGETLRTARQFEPWLKARAMAVAQPDIMRTGITGALRIAALAGTMHVPTALHTGVCTGIGMAATWQVASALPGSIPQEHQHDLFEASGKLLKTPLVANNGVLEVPRRPGIGVEVDEQAVASVSSEHWIVDAAGRRLAEQSIRA